MNVSEQLLLLHRLLNKSWNAEELDLSYNEFEYLHCIHVAEQVDPDEYDMQHDDSTHLSSLANDLQVKKSSVSVMLNKLEKRGLTQRVTCRYDARAQHILTTEKGREYLAKAAQSIYETKEQQLKQKLEPQEFEQLNQLLHKVLNT
ncbi:MarR family winged helix-turn-helix transcriptional regulator [Algicola sagamiensis]|uniref:MarR family winged helix-turn-helix transcriptional regulator n=1 Tax=Algicola sagamiensis TaxID=163869 RepID=UPI00037E659C|nr:MarR family transcriptional regulator [Algicola sagamiensis]